jgi:5-methylthioadenosine/S-adenosylhomocysteine deaminase
MISVGTCAAKRAGRIPTSRRAAWIPASRLCRALDDGPGRPCPVDENDDAPLKRNVGRSALARQRSRRRVLRQIMVCSPALIRDIGAAREHDVKIHTHLCEGTYEIDYALEIRQAARRVHAGKGVLTAGCIARIR